MNQHDNQNYPHSYTIFSKLLHDKLRHCALPDYRLMYHPTYNSFTRDSKEEEESIKNCEKEYFVKYYFRTKEHLEECKELVNIVITQLTFIGNVSNKTNNSNSNAFGYRINNLCLL